MSKQTKAWICDAVRTPIGRYGGGLSSVRTDDLGAVPIAALIKRNPNLPPEKIDDLIYGCANQASNKDNRNVARMSLLLAGVPPSVPAATVNRLCGSGMNALGNAAHAIKAGGAHVMVAGGVESMSRAPFVLAKSTAAFGRNAEIYDTTLGWRFVNKKLEQQYGIDSMAETAENVAAEFKVSREEQDQFALRSQQKAAEAMASGRLNDEIVPVAVPQRRGNPVDVKVDESSTRPPHTGSVRWSLPVTLTKAISIRYALMDSTGFCSFSGPGRSRTGTESSRPFLTSVRMLRSGRPSGKFCTASRRPRGPRTSLSTTAPCLRYWTLFTRPSSLGLISRPVLHG